MNSNARLMTAGDAMCPPLTDTVLLRLDYRERLAAVAAGNLRGFLISVLSEGFPGEATQLADRLIASKYAALTADKRKSLGLVITLRQE